MRIFQLGMCQLGMCQLGNGNVSVSAVGARNRQRGGHKSYGVVFNQFLVWLRIAR